MTKNENIMFEYDDEMAVEFIRNYLPLDLKEKFTDDTVYYILDVICEFYEKRDWLDDDDEEKEEQELTRFIIEQAAKDGIGQFTEEEIKLVLVAEAAYSDTLEIPE
ncbi:hypothetical protein FACS189474_5950 [Bacteroidia bacterium]|nr:hypothetical protein FACS189423_07390 [Bacteroidia bacterium]GHT46111.1 hypothetical protein FACS189440_03440 [Bacteroidia bacterium]GHT89360.1 hypothetical protein FACS189474_5950 [Bacteroidia bacterium]